MDVISSLIYGTFQGITEFAPVSSSGHLAILPHFLHIEDPGVYFDLSLHLGTALAVIVYFFKDIKFLFMRLIETKFHPKKNGFTVNLIIATIATVVVALPFKSLALEYGRNLYLVAFNFIVFGLLMYLFDRYSKESDEKITEEKISVIKPFMIGVAQAFAIFPGVSRSGITMTIGRAFSLSRAEASKFSFLLSLPVIIGGFILTLPEASTQSFDHAKIISSLIGGTVAFVAGLATIHFFLRVISRIGLKYFAIYRIILAAIILIHISFF